MISIASLQGKSSFRFPCNSTPSHQLCLLKACSLHHQAASTSKTHVGLTKSSSRVRHPYLRNNFTTGSHCITFPLRWHVYCTNSINSPLLISISPPFRRRPFGNIWTRTASSDAGKLSIGGPMLALVLTTLSVMTKASIAW